MFRFNRPLACPRRSMFKSTLMTDGHNDIHESVTPMDGKVDYSQWSSEKLIERVTALEEDLRHQNARSAPAVLLFAKVNV